MRPFEYGSALDASDACSKGTDRSSFIAGGTTLIDLMKLEVMNPSRLVDLNSLPMRGITIDDKELRIGALEKMSAVAANPIVANQLSHDLSGAVAKRFATDSKYGEHWGKSLAANPVRLFSRYEHPV